MSEGTPWLPLTPARASSLVRALDAAVPQEGRPPDVAVLLLERLIAVLRAEREHVLAQPPARRLAFLRRLRRSAWARGVGGDFGQVPHGLPELVEEVRQGLDDGVGDAALIAGILARQAPGIDDARPPVRWTVREVLALLAGPGGPPA